MLLKVDCLPNAVGKQPSMPLIDLGRKWTLSWWWWWWWWWLIKGMVFAGRELVTTQSFVWNALGGFTKNVVAFQESWRVMLISIAGDVWRVRMASFSQFCWKRLWLNPMWSWNVFPSSAIWATHLVQEEVWRRRQEPEWDVLGLSSRSYLLSWQLRVHHTA